MREDTFAHTTASASDSPKSRSPAAHPIRLLNGGTEAFPRMITAIDGAQKRIHLEVYGFYRGNIGARFLDSLNRAAHRGVRVQVILDGWGSLLYGRYVERVLRASGCEVAVYNPLSSLLVGRMWRNHRKILLIDDDVAWIGGFNIGDQYAVSRSGPGWVDLALEIRGPACHQLVERIWREGRKKGTHSVRILLSDLRGGHRLRKRCLHAIGRAEQRIYLVQAYFLPDRRFLRSLTAAARRGVEVVLLLPGRSDVPFYRLATTRLYRRLLSAGARIFECEQSILHAKVLSIDGRHVLTGSFNLDPLSLMNLEDLVEIDDPVLGVEVDKWIVGHLAHAHEVRMKDDVGSQSARWLRDLFGYFLLYVARKFARFLVPRRTA